MTEAMDGKRSQGWNGGRGNAQQRHRSIQTYAGRVRQVIRFRMVHRFTLVRAISRPRILTLTFLSSTRISALLDFFQARIGVADPIARGVYLVGVDWNRAWKFSLGQ